VNSIKQHNSGVDCQGNTIRMAVWNAKSDCEELVDENLDAGEDDYDFASPSQGIRSGPNRVRRNVSSMAWRITKIWMGTWTPLN